MTRLATLTATAAAALGIAFAPAPAVANDGNDLAKIIAGIAVAGIVAKAIDDRRDRKKARRNAEHAAQQKAERLRGRGNGVSQNRRGTIEGNVRSYNRDDDRRWPRLGKDVKRVALPDRCLRTVETARGNRLAYGVRCLERRYKHANRLPQRCETVVRTPRGLRTVYGVRCLRRDGWQVARR